MNDTDEPTAPTRLRAATAKTMARSKQTIPHFYMQSEIDMEALSDAVTRMNASAGQIERVSMTPFLIRALALTLTEHPLFNAVWDGESLRRVQSINIGIAIALDEGLVAPALLDCRDRPVAELAIALNDLIARSRIARLRAAELTETTFTLSNLGMFDISSFTAIITPPQVAVLATARSEARAVVRGGVVVARRMMNATLSADHRAVDGVHAARFLATFKQLAEDPASWNDASGRRT